MRYFGIISAAGVGSRMNLDTPKQYLKILDKTIIEHSLLKLSEIHILSEIVVVIHPKDVLFKNIKLPDNITITTITGGTSRRDSVLNALNYLQTQAQFDDWVLVHDAARPLVKVNDINRMIEQLKNDPVGGILAHKISDTLKQTTATNTIKTLNRDNIWRALTPQMFRFKILHEAIKKFSEITDESQAIELLGYQSKLVKGDASNIKITTTNDLLYAKWLLQQKNN